MGQHPHAHGFLQDAVVLSDDAGQFDIGQHALCWVHAERLVHKLDTFTDLHRAAQQRTRTLIWNFYADLKTYRANPSKNRRAVLRARFDRIFRRRTGFVTLDRARAQALRRFATQPQTVSFADCIVMAIADEYETKAIFGFDADHARNGYLVLNQ